VRRTALHRKRRVRPPRDRPLPAPRAFGVRRRAARLHPEAHPGGDSSDRERGAGREPRQEAACGAQRQPPMVPPKLRLSHPRTNVGHNESAGTTDRCISVCLFRHPRKTARVRPRRKVDLAHAPYAGPLAAYRGYAPSMKTIWTSRMAQATAKYGENAPTAAVCCNACRTCVQTNVIGLGLAAVGGAVAATRRYFVRPS
jgi:hypothetical protein